MFQFCQSDQGEEIQHLSVTTVSLPEVLRRSSSYGLGSVQHQSDNGTPQFASGGHRLSIIPTLPSTEPLELLALTNEAICDRDALVACKRLSELCKDLSTAWLREQVAQCLARALLLFGDVFPYTSKFPPLDAFFSSVPLDEQVAVAVIVHDRRKSEVLAPNSFDVVLDGLESYPVTFFKAQPPIPCSNEFHAEAVMLSNIPLGETLHLQDMRGQVSTSSALGSSRRNRQGATYFARRLYENIVVVICFARTHREASDAAVVQFLDKLSRLFVL